MLKYKLLEDLSLTVMQTKGGFRPDIVDRIVKRAKIGKGAFRFPSNPTMHGFSSGYHEAFVVTDMTDVISRRSQVSSGRSAMPQISSGYWQKHSGTAFPEANVSALLHAGDGARTDTARTILSGPGGKVAGHSGSGIDTTGQAAAHDVLRDQAMRALGDPHMTPRAFGVLAAATTLFSMAPGELASKAGNAARLKDQRARFSWEDDRNEAKERLAVAHASLPPAEQARVMHHMGRFAAEIGGGRKLEVSRPSSPRRQRQGTVGAPIQGGGYDPFSSTSGAPSIGLAPHADPQTTSLYVTEPFRVQRRK
ncbi:hypothetical protein E6C76_14000 [Pseudothauera nasutitermitis]|uniref:Uncharacterized protein n=1 Tax=Pseudothauera nasutitermitis TaxID=2565930 RepID=A0A4S4AUQ1_9RHOO|nr:hypothetical protein [Pseudothauera nasutitermitis]THF63697.1 hypothetical protein E6C76_14000 [Pseudothauera nasutitermitis]